MSDLTQEQLESQLNEACRERLETRLKSASDKTVVGKSRELRREIARLMTEIRRREIVAGG